MTGRRVRGWASERQRNGDREKKERGARKKERKKVVVQLAMNGWLTWGPEWIRVYGRSTTSTTPRGQG